MENEKSKVTLPNEEILAARYVLAAMTFHELKELKADKDSPQFLMLMGKLDELLTMPPEEWDVVAGYVSERAAS